MDVRDVRACVRDNCGKVIVNVSSRVCTGKLDGEIVVMGKYIKASKVPGSHVIDGRRRTQWCHDNDCKW